jgi:hypothetical protein
MPGIGINMELDIDAAGGSDLTAAAYDWFDTASRAALGAPRSSLEGKGPTPTAPDFVDPLTWNPDQSPVQLRGSLTVTGRRPKAFDAKVWPWLRQRFAEEPQRADLEFWLAAGPDPDSPNAWYPSLYAHRSPESPGWLRVGAYVAESVLVDETHGVEAQQLWLGILRSFAERFNPGFGQIEYGYDTRGTTGLEYSFPPDVELEERVADYTVKDCRRYLRGYSWLTVVPAELAERLGGVDQLHRSGAFADVEVLPHGGVWLLATKDYREYGTTQYTQVFRALAPVLRPGKPVSKAHHTDPKPQRVVFEDAAGTSRR